MIDHAADANKDISPEHVGRKDFAAADPQPPARAAPALAAVGAAPGPSPPRGRFVGDAPA